MGFNLSEKPVHTYTLYSTSTRLSRKLSTKYNHKCDATAPHRATSGDGEHRYTAQSSERSMIALLRQRRVCIAQHSAVASPSRLALHQSRRCIEISHTSRERRRSPATVSGLAMVHGL